MAPFTDPTSPVPPDPSRRHATAGFTLVELLVAMAVVAVLVVAAVPSFTSVVNANRLAGLTNDVIASLQVGRMEAIRRGVRVVMCNSDDGATCTDDAAWTGWIVYADLDGDGTADAGEVLRSETVKPPLQVLAGTAINNADNEIVFRPDGLARATDGALLRAAIAVCIPTARPADNVRVVSLRSGSRVTSAPLDDNSACEAPDDPT